MPPAERALVQQILASIYGDADPRYVAGLLRTRTWATVYEQVRRERPGLFNALNLASLKVGRPSPLEAPIDCSHLRSGEDYLRAWLAWYGAGLKDSIGERSDKSICRHQKLVQIVPHFGKIC